MSAEAVQVIYKKLVYWIADTAPDDSRRVEINMEVMTDDDEIANSWTIRGFTGDAETKLDDYPAEGAEKIEMLDLFMELHNLSSNFGDQWTVCDFVVTNDGKFNVDYKYDAPPRLSGDLTA